MIHSFAEAVIENNYKIDIVIILKRMDYLKDETYETRILTIEFDGNDYHEEPVRFKRD